MNEEVVEILKYIEANFSLNPNLGLYAEVTEDMTLP